MAATHARPSPAEVERARRFVEEQRAKDLQYTRWFATAAIGRGLRFNNPFRLRTVLGDDASSLSLTATYVDLAVGGSVGDWGSLEHGAVLHGSFALDGIAQEVVTPSYLLSSRIDPRFLVGARAGIPIVLRPDLSAGMELGALGVWRVLAGLGAYAELVGSLFYGAATLDADRTMIPVVALQLGVWADVEVLP